jgi:hypothetical protein
MTSPRVLRVLAVALLLPVPAWSLTFVLHHAVPPVSVPGGSTSFCMDQIDSPAQPPVVESITLQDGETAAFPTFTSLAFGSDTTLDPFALPDIQFSADQEMTDCADMGFTVSRIDAGGATTELATLALAGKLIPATPDGGATGFADWGAYMPIGTGVVVQAGEGVTLTTSVTNHCGSARTVYLSYDSDSAQSLLSFVPRSTVELNCQRKTALAAGKFIALKEKCLVGCLKHASAGSEPASDCVPPYAGKTAECVARMESKTAAAEAKCGACPACYSGGDCTADGLARVPGLEALVDGLVPQVFCDDSGSGDGLNFDEFRCQWMTAGSVGDIASGVLKCLSACQYQELKGKIPPGSCLAPVSDTRTALCLQMVTDRVVRKIDHSCAGRDTPECYTLDGLGWVDLVRPQIEGLVDGLFCTTP